jgi:SAM-dependent methyltransferase
MSTVENMASTNNQKKIRSKLASKKIEFVIQDETPQAFKLQVDRTDVLENMLLHKNLLPANELFELLMNENKGTPDESRQGWIYETLFIILSVVKCFKNINYTEFSDGQIQNLKPIKNINSLLKIRIAGGGNNKSDMSIKDGTTRILFSVKYKGKFGETDVSKIDNTIIRQGITQDYKIGLVVKDKALVINHKYKNQMNIDKQLHDKVIENGLLFDKTDVINALAEFCEKFSSSKLDVDGFIDLINAEYLLSPRQQLIKKLHQKMTEMKFINSFLKNRHKMWCISHKPRSGKSITMLLICKYLLENGYNRLLIMTSVPATINNFVNDLEKYIDFKGIQYKLQDEFATIDASFNGIVFCSTEYLKVNKLQKKESLKRIGFDAIFTDESHLGGSTDKTKTDILDIDSDIEELRANIKLNIFASGTADKTKKYYGIHSSCIYEWEIEDESYMKRLIATGVTNKDEIVEYMVNRHGDIFAECLVNETLNKDYSKHPTQVLMKHSIPDLLVDEIKEYNSRHGTSFGYNCASLFALNKCKKAEPERDKSGNVIKTPDGYDFYDYEYTEEFELCKTSDGISILKSFFECILSKNRMNQTVMKQIEETQTSRGSRKSTTEKPLLFIVYLPTHTRNNTIDKLQKTIKQFLETHNLWGDYNIEYSNSVEDTGYVKEEYNEYIKTIMDRAKNDNKRGCFLLLGNKGSVGITYHDCDVTISLDDGQNLDNQKQRFSRALTEAEGKTIGINVDMNIQRTYLYLIDIIQKHRRNTKTTRSNAEILHYLFEQNIFLFDPHQIRNGKMSTVDIMSYYQTEADNIMTKIDDEPFLENLSCNDDMRDLLIKMTVEKNKTQKKINSDLDGEQPDCPKGDKTVIEVDAPVTDTGTTQPEESEGEISETEVALINKTLELCKYIFPYLAIISKSYKISDFKEILVNPRTKWLIISFLKYKKIEVNNDNIYLIIVNIMNNIIDNNAEIVNNIREIYSRAPSHKLRDLIAKHFIPTQEEKKGNAEVSTPVELCDDMLKSPQDEFWKTPKKVLEPCCGKGNVLLGIVRKFDEGLKELYPDNEERIRIIMTECIYYADLTALNVFITTELLRCEFESICGINEIDFEFNNYTGDTLELNIEDKWNISGFNMVCGNPPYNSSGDTATGNTIWQDFTKKALNEWLLPNGYLLFVHPPGWRKPNTERGKFTKMFDLMTKQNQMIYLEIHGIKDGQRVFNCGTRYDWYLIEKTNQYKNTIIADEDGTRNEINLSELSWLPNSNILEINKIIAKDDCERCPIIQSMSAYEPRKKWMASKETEEFKYPCVHSTPKAGIRYMYSKVNDRGHFGVSKVIFGESGIYKPVIDMEGKYGMTHGAMAIQVDNLEEATFISKVIENDKFDKVIQSCIFSSFRIDWNIFKEFKKDFWKEFI